MHDGFGRRPLPEPDYEWVISRVCEEFPAYTLKGAQRAWDEDPELIMRIIQMRGFARAKQGIAQAKDWNDLPSPLPQSYRDYMAIEAEIHKDFQTGAIDDFFRPAKSGGSDSKDRAGTERAT